MTITKFTFYHFIWYLSVVLFSIDTCNEPDQAYGTNYCYVKTSFNGGSQKIDWFGAQTYCNEKYNGDVAYSFAPNVTNSIYVLLGGTESIDVWFGVWRRRWHWRSGM